MFQELLLKIFTVMKETNTLDPKYILALLNSKVLNFRYKNIWKQNGDGKLLIPQIPKDYSLYLKNIDYLLNMPKKEKYDKETRYPVAIYDNKEIFLTEFLVAKQFGYLPKFQGHGELKEYFRLLPFVFSNNMFDEIFENLDNKRDIYSFFYSKDYRMFHILDENNDLVSCFVNSSKNFNKQIDKKFVLKSAREGGYFSILSPAEPFWRQADFMEQLYQDLEQKSISQNDFISWVDKILASKEKITKYKKHFKSLNAVEKIEIQEEIEKLENLVQNSIDEIDKLAYRLYGLVADEIKQIESQS